MRKAVTAMALGAPGLALSRPGYSPGGNRYPGLRLSPVLPLVDLLDGFYGIDVLRQLVLAHAYDAREAQRVSAVVPVASHDGVEGNLEHNLGLDFAQVAVVGGGVRQQPLR